MGWSLRFQIDAEKDLVGIDPKTRHQIIKKLDRLIFNFDSVTPLVLTGEFRDFYKLRVGGWRVFYKVDWKQHLIIVCYINWRDKAYKHR